MGERFWLSAIGPEAAGAVGQDRQIEVRMVFITPYGQLTTCTQAVFSETALRRQGKGHPYKGRKPQPEEPTFTE